MTTRTFISCKLVVPGTHYWTAAKNYLAFEHRHLFEIVAVKEVAHNDRDIEFLQFQELIEQYLYSTYPAEGHTLLFGSSSCEQIAQRLFDHFELESCWVYEDGENGGGVVRA